MSPYWGEDSRCFRGHQVRAHGQCTPPARGVGVEARRGGAPCVEASIRWGTGVAAQPPEPGAAATFSGGSRE